MVKISKKWLIKSAQYKNKAEEYWFDTAACHYRALHSEYFFKEVPLNLLSSCPYDFSATAALKMYLFESKGIGSLEVDIFSNNVNGFAIGKKWLDVYLNRFKREVKLYSDRKGT